DRRCALCRTVVTLSCSPRSWRPQGHHGPRWACASPLWLSWGRRTNRPAGVVVRRDRGGSPAPRWHVLFAGLCVTFRVGVTAAVLGVGLFGLVHHPVGQLLAQRGTTPLTGHLTSGFVGQGPGPEIDDRVGAVLLVAAGVGEDPVGACDRVPLATDVVDGELEVLRYFGFLGGRDRRLQGRLDRFTVLVDDA